MEIYLSDLHVLPLFPSLILVLPQWPALWPVPHLRAFAFTVLNVCLTYPSLTSSLYQTVTLSVRPSVIPNPTPTPANGNIITLPNPSILYPTFCFVFL